MVSSHPVWSNASFIWPSVAIDLSTLIANLFLAFAVLRQKRRGKWSGMDEIIMAYAITGISLVLIILPLIIAAKYGNDSGSWPGGIYSCSLYQCTVLFSEIASVSFVTVLALERTAVIKRSVANDLAFKIGDLAKARVKIAFVLVIASLFSICPLIKLAPNGFEKGDCQSVFIVSGDDDSSQNKDPGVENEPSHLQHKNEQTLFLLFLMYGYLSFIACIVLYLALIAQLCNLQHRQASDEERCQEVNAHLMKQEKVDTFNRTLTVVIAGAVFYVTWLPSLVRYFLKCKLRFAFSRYLGHVEDVPIFSRHPDSHEGPCFAFSRYLGHDEDVPIFQDIQIRMDVHVYLALLKFVFTGSDIHAK